MKKDKGTNNILQNITHKTKDRVTRTPLKLSGDLSVANAPMNGLQFLYHWQFRVLSLLLPVHNTVKL